jgi:excisionase family DNA binding protein
LVSITVNARGEKFIPKILLPGFGPPRQNRKNVAATSSLAGIVIRIRILGMAMADNSLPPKVLQPDATHGTSIGERVRRYLTISELSDATGISISTLRRLLRKGTLPFYQPGGPRTRIVFPIDAIEQATKTNKGAARQSDDAIAASEAPARGPRPRWQEGCE